MGELVLDVRLDGFSNPVGALVRASNGALAFAYEPTYVRQPNAVPLSLSLPLSTEPFADIPTRSFFDNLLQERDSLLRQVMANHGLQRDDVAGLLWYLGKDCPGALSVLPVGAPPVKLPGDYETDYAPISESRLAAIVRALHNRERLPAGMADPSPLAGVQSKIALTKLPNGCLAEPNKDSGAPTTHILKVPDRRRPMDAKLEQQALALSYLLKFEAAEAELLTAGQIEALLVKRFDRAHDSNGRVIRIHQEDFAQALGLPPELKYERRGTPERRFDVSGICWILNQTNSPAVERLRLVRETLFDIAIGNADAHAKNRALAIVSVRKPRSYPANAPLSTSPTVFRITASSKSPSVGSPVRENAMAPQCPSSAAILPAMRIAWSELRASFGSHAMISPPSSDRVKASAT